MKYVIIQGDGMGDEPIAELGGKTPLEAAQTPHFDWVAGQGQIGLLHTIPEGLPPGSDVGNLSLFGYDPALYYTGRSPLEAAAMGVELGPQDVAFRMNLVACVGSGAGETLADYSGGHIDSASAAELVQAVSAELADEEIQFYPGVSYRHLMVWRGGSEAMKTTPPHDITGQAIAGHLPRGDGAQPLLDVMRRSREIFEHHPVNRRRSAEGGTPVTQVWLWGQGKAPRMPTFEQCHGLKGAVISAVDLVRGLAVYAGFDIVTVPGATAFLDTNYRGKGEHALAALADHDLVFVHIEAPDEAGHMGDVVEKVKAIESIDREIVGPLIEGLPTVGPFKLLITSDHATPVARRTHVAAPVPFAMATGDQLRNGKLRKKYGETEAERSGVRIPDGHRVIADLMNYPE
ncbi:MAG: cofactor-independent phosphoglycerate mutase [SAR324 cluster bacterium]|nr:cofactor-independent phosphoglycerate mutase [SAR324 cluster bacterium]